jgi:hypothetical protein
MTTAIIKTDGETALSAAEVRAQVNLIQEVMQSVMKNGTHYGTIPGCPKPSLFKAGAEKIAVTFHIAVQSRAEDLSTPDAAAYRVTAEASTAHGRFLGAAVGVCSSDEEKYRWRKPVCDEEFAETPENLRREVWKKVYGKAAKVKQVRTEPADIANTILQMADKRAYVAVVRRVTAASDVFTQDIEDLPPEVAAGIAEGDATPPVQMPTARPAAKPRAAEPAHADPGDGTSVTGPVEAVTSKQTKTGGWRHGIKISEAWYNTFDGDIAGVAEDAKNAGQEVTLHYKTNERGYHDATGIQRLDAPPPQRQEDDPGSDPAM